MLVQRIIIRQADLDTVTCAFLLGIRADAAVEAVCAEASKIDLCNPQVVCIECGGSGQTDLSNFDHHDPSLDLPPACIQAALHAGNRLSAWWVSSLVDYAASVDLGLHPKRPRVFPDLSHVFSGLRLCSPTQVAIFRRGLQLLEDLQEAGSDPHGPLELGKEWAPCLVAKCRNRGALGVNASRAVTFETLAGRKCGVLATHAIGAHGALRAIGCEIGIAMHPLSETGMRRYTIASPNVSVKGYLPALKRFEAGWGGPSHGTVIGSPWAGSRLSPETVIEIVRNDSGTEFGPSFRCKKW